MFARLRDMFTEEMLVNIMGWLCVAILVSMPFLFLFVAEEPPECLVKTTERGNRLHITLDCPMSPASALEASADEK